LDQFPKQSGRVPWTLRQNYLVDLLNLRLRPIDDGTLVFSKGGQGEMASVPGVTG
jgi:monooxygenase